MNEPSFSAIIGGAGSGKSTLINKRVKEDPRYGLRTSTTGISALNMGDDVITINSALGYFDTKQLLFKVVNKQIQSKIEKIAKIYDNLIIDECFDYKQPILTENGWQYIGVIVNKKLPIKVYSRNPNTGNLELKPIVRWIKNPRPLKMLKIVVSRFKDSKGARILQITPTHKILTPNGYIEARNLSIDSEVLVSQIEKKDTCVGYVQSITPYTSNDHMDNYVYDLEIADHHNYVAGGVIVSNCSMLEAAQLDLIYQSVQEYNFKSKKKIGILLSGDPGQLPSISGKPFFEARCWNMFDVTYLDKIYRQNDKDFIEALSHIRKGKADQAVDWFEKEVGFNNEVDQEFEGATFFSKNSDVDQYNLRRLVTLKGPTFRYKSKTEGIASTLWKEIPLYVDIKVDSLVITLVNNIEGGYANGDLARVVDVYNNSIFVRLLRNNRVVQVEYCKSENKPIGYKNSIGSLSYLPIRLAWSTSIHRSQSLSLKSVQIKLGDDFLSNLSGGCYTAISRCTNKSGLRLVGDRDLFLKSCYVDPRYAQYLK